MAKCQSGNCGISCKGDCVCMSIVEDPKPGKSAQKEEKRFRLSDTSVELK